MTLIGNIKDLAYYFSSIALLICIILNLYYTYIKKITLKEEANIFCPLMITLINCIVVSTSSLYEAIPIISAISIIMWIAYSMSINLAERFIRKGIESNNYREAYELEAEFDKNHSKELLVEIKKASRKSKRIKFLDFLCRVLILPVILLVVFWLI